MNVEPQSRRSVLWLWIIVSVVVFGSAMLLFQVFTQKALRTTPGEPRASFVSRAPGGDLVVLVDRVAAARGLVLGMRVVALDAKTGERLTARVFDALGTCWAASPGHAWCDDTKGGLSLLALPGLEVLATADSLIGRAGFAPARRRAWRAEGEDVVVLLSDGGGARVASGSLEVTSVDGQGIVGESPPDTRCGTSLLTKAPASVSLAATCQHAELVAGRLVVTTTSPKVRATAIDLATGAAAWTFGF